MTKLLNRVTRELQFTTVDFGKHRNRSINITLIPGDMIEFHIKGTQQRYDIPLKFCYVLAEILAVSDSYKKRMKEYKDKLNAGYKRLRKPKRIIMPYSKIFFEALNK